jgi:hypothetical protein
MTGFFSAQDIIPASYMRVGQLGDVPITLENGDGLVRRLVQKCQRFMRSFYHIAGFVLFNTLAVLGAFVLFFVMLGKAQPAGFFIHIREVSRRFLEATSARQADFLLVVSVVFLALFILLSALRATRLRDRLVEGSAL